MFGSLLAHAAVLAGTLAIYSAASMVPSAAASIALIVALPGAASILAFAVFSRYAKANSALQAVMLVLLAVCALCQFFLTPFLSCLVSRNFCL